MNLQYGSTASLQGTYKLSEPQPAQPDQPLSRLESIVLDFQIAEGRLRKIQNKRIDQVQRVVGHMPLFPGLQVTDNPVDNSLLGQLDAVLERIKQVSDEIESLDTHFSAHA